MHDDNLLGSWAGTPKGWLATDKEDRKIIKNLRRPWMKTRNVKKEGEKKNKMKVEVNREAGGRQRDDGNRLKKVVGERGWEFLQGATEEDKEKKEKAQNVAMMKERRLKTRRRRVKTTVIKTIFIKKKKFHQNPLSSKTNFIKNHFHQKTTSIKNQFHQRPLSSETTFKTNPTEG